MTRSHISEGLLAAWALDAVDDAERVEIERAFAADSDIAARARSLQATMGEVTIADAVDPPPELRAKVLSEISSLQDAAETEEAVGTEPAAERNAAQPRLEVVDGQGSRRRRRKVVGRWLAAAAALIAVAIPTGIAVQQADRAEQSEQQVHAVVDALADPEAAVSSAAVEGGGRAVVVTGSLGTIFAMQGMQSPGQGQDYQLWSIRPQGPVSEGVLSMPQVARGVEIGSIPAASALAVTREPAGGSEQPTTDPIVTLELGG